MPKFFNLHIEIEKSFCGKRFSKRLSFASFARAGNDQLLLELEVSAIKPMQNEGSERLAVAEGVFDFSIPYKFNQEPHKQTSKVCL